MRLGQPNQTATVGAVDKLVLRDAQSAARIQDLAELTTLSVAELKSPKLSIEAVVSGTVSSVAFLFDRNELVEVEEPFTYPGDIDGELKSFDAEVGSHSITATPYSALGAEGQRGASFKVVLTFVE
jgi:hypothetical protein